MRASIDSACATNPSARAIARSRPRQLLRRSHAHLGHRAPEGARGQRRREPGRAAGGEHVVGARHVVPERRPGGRAHEQASRAAHPRRQALGSVAHELQVLGRQILDEGQRGLEVGRVDENRRGAGASASGSASASSRSADGDTATTRLAGPCSAWASRSAATRRGVGRLVEHHRELARAGEGVDAHHVRESPLGLLDVGVAGAGDHVDGGRRVSVPSASAATACAPPIR